MELGEANRLICVPLSAQPTTKRKKKRATKANGTINSKELQIVPGDFRKIKNQWAAGPALMG